MLVLIKPGKTKLGFSKSSFSIPATVDELHNIYGFLEDPEGSRRKIIKENKLNYQNSPFPLPDNNKIGFKITSKSASENYEII